jgi:hypothetical protein
MHSVEIANGEHIGVATSFTLPDLFDGVTTKDALEVQRKVAEAEKNDNPYRMSVQEKDCRAVDQYEGAEASRSA